MQSVASINPTEPRSMPALDRQDTGSDSFSLLLDTASQQPENPAPEAGPSSCNESSPPPRKTESRPAEGSTAQPKDASGKANASCERSGGDAPKAGDATAKEKNPGKSSKQPSDSDGEKEAAQAVAATDPLQCAPQAGDAAAILVGLNVPNIESGGNASAGGNSAKAVGVEIVAAAAAGTPTLVAPGAPGAAGAPGAVGAAEAPGAPGALGTPGAPAAPGGVIAPGAPVAPQALAAPEAPKSSAETPPPANEGAAQAAAAIAAAAKSERASPPNDLPVVTEDGPKETPNTEVAAKMFAEAPKLVAANEGGEPNQISPAAGKATPGNAPAPLTLSVGDAGKPSSGDDLVATVRLMAKAAPNSRAPEMAAADQTLETAAIRPVSLTAELSQPATLPQSLDAFASALKSASAELQAPGTAASGQGVPLTSAAIAVEIAARAKEGSRQFDIRLDPPELGRIDVRLDVDKSGGVSTRLTVDRPETLQLLQNDARGLERALQSAGLKTEDGSLQFSLRQQSPDGSAGQQAQSGTDPRPGTIYVDDEGSAAAGLEQYQLAARLRGGVDIRV